MWGQDKITCWRQPVGVRNGKYGHLVHRPLNGKLGSFEWGKDGEARLQEQRKCSGEKTEMV